MDLYGPYMSWLDLQAPGGVKYRQNHFYRAKILTQKSAFRGQLPVEKYLKSLFSQIMTISKLWKKFLRFARIISLKS